MPTIAVKSAEGRWIRIAYVERDGLWVVYYADMLCRYVFKEMAHDVAQKLHQHTYPSHPILNSSGPSGVVTLASLPRGNPYTAKKEDYPDVRFWYKSAWDKFSRDQKYLKSIAKAEPEAIDVGDGSQSSHAKGPAQRGRARAVSGENVMCGFMENSHGETLDGHVVGDMREFMQRWWTDRAVEGETIPKTWTAASLPLARRFRDDMATEFFEFSLCASSWKADKMAILYYPSFQQGQKRKDTMGTKRSLVKDEGAGQSVDLLGLITSLLADDSPEAKKPKLYTFDTPDDSVREISQPSAASASNAATSIKTQAPSPKPSVQARAIVQVRSYQSLQA